MPLAGWRWLESGRFNMIVQTAASKLETSGWPLLFTDRVPMVDAFDDEIVGRFTQKLIAADIVMNDQEAVVQEAGRIDIIVNAIPNIKRGVRLGQQLLNRLDQLKQYGTVLPRDTEAMDNLFFDLARNLLLGVRQRLNQFACGMLIDQLHYDRLGVKFDGVWAMPSNLKATAATTWDQATATPITDILVLANQVAPDNYGMRYNRVTMSSKAFTYMSQTSEFINKSKTFYGFDLGSAGLNVANRPAMQKIAGFLLDMEVEIYDAVIREKNEDGTTVATRVLPQNMVLLTNSDYDNNGSYYDIANAVVTESIVASLTGEGPVGARGGRQVGPLGYYSVRNDLNPPDMTAWAVMRAVPRKHVPEASARIVVGNLGTAAWPG
jgi:hypothetical protein